MKTSENHQHDKYTEARLQRKLQLVQGILEWGNTWAASHNGHFTPAGRYPHHPINALSEESTPLRIDEAEFGFPFLQVIKWTSTASRPQQADRIYIDYDFRGRYDDEPLRRAYHPPTSHEELLRARDIDTLWIGRQLVSPAIAFERLDYLIRHAIVPAAS